MFSTLLLLLLLFFVILPLMRGMTAIWRLRNQYRRAQQRMNDIFGSATGNRRQAQPKPERKAKKIDPNVGEYVAFEEIKVSQTTTVTDDPSTNTRTVKTESQIEDAVWEEI